MKRYESQLLSRVVGAAVLAKHANVKVTRISELVQSCLKAPIIVSVKFNIQLNSDDLKL